MIGNYLWELFMDLRIMVMILTHPQFSIALLKLNMKGRHHHIIQEIDISG
jgi:hypothetical protein